MIRARAATPASAATAAAAAVAAALALTGCATASQGRDVVAVVQDEQGRQAAVEAAKDGENADAALSHAAEGRTAPTEPPR